jgi:hypothetical protein
MFYAYFLIWETKGLTLEQVDRMMEETQSPRHSASWRPHSTFAGEMGMAHDGGVGADGKHMDAAHGEKVHGNGGEAGHVDGVNVPTVGGRTAV